MPPMWRAHQHKVGRLASLRPGIRAGRDKGPGALSRIALARGRLTPGLAVERQGEPECGAATRALLHPHVAVICPRSVRACGAQDERQSAVRGGRPSRSCPRRRRRHRADRHIGSFGRSSQCDTSCSDGSETTSRSAKPDEDVQTRDASSHPDLAACAC